MSVTGYKVWAVGSPVGIGVTGAINIGFAAIAKKSTIDEPHIVSNELICNYIARSLLLPCPPGALLSYNDDSYFATLNFNVGGLALPPADPTILTKEQTSLSWGIILFDTLCMNADRHVWNISHNQTTKEVQIFDHTHAFVGTNGNVSTTLADRVDLLSIGRHCLAGEIQGGDGYQMWCDRIKTLPEFFIEGIIADAWDVGILPAYKNQCVDSLLKRRNRIENLIQDNLGSFPNLPHGAI